MPSPPGQILVPAGEVQRRRAQQAQPLPNDTDESAFTQVDSPSRGKVLVPAQRQEGPSFGAKMALFIQIQKSLEARRSAQTDRSTGGAVSRLPLPGGVGAVAAAPGLIHEAAVGVLRGLGGGYENLGGMLRMAGFEDVGQAVRAVGAAGRARWPATDSGGEITPMAVAGAVGEGAVQLIPQLGIALASGGASIPIQLTIFSGTAAVQMVGTQFNEAMDAHGDYNKAVTESGAGGLITVATNLVPGAAILRRVPGGEKALKAAASKMVGRFATAGGAEALQEMSEQVVTDAAASLIRKDPAIMQEILALDPEYWSQVGLAGIAGGLLGGAGRGTAEFASMPVEQQAAFIQEQAAGQKRAISDIANTLTPEQHQAISGLDQPSRADFRNAKIKEKLDAPARAALSQELRDREAQAPAKQEVTEAQPAPSVQPDEEVKTSLPRLKPGDDAAKVDERVTQPEARAQAIREAAMAKEASEAAETPVQESDAVSGGQVAIRSFNVEAAQVIEGAVTVRSKAEARGRRNQQKKLHRKLTKLSLCLKRLGK